MADTDKHMSGPEHYAYAEDLLRQADYWHGQAEEGGTAQDADNARMLVAQAQVHATLANAAAVALTAAHGGSLDTNTEWAEVAGHADLRDRARKDREEREQQPNAWAKMFD